MVMEWDQWAEAQVEEDEAGEEQEEEAMALAATASVRGVGPESPTKRAYHAGASSARTVDRR